MKILTNKIFWYGLFAGTILRWAILGLTYEVLRLAEILGFLK